MVSRLNVDNKPSCSDFIIAAIKMIRPRSGKLKPNTAGGAKFCKIFRLARELYPTREIRSSIEDLIQKKRVVLATYLLTWKDGKCDSLDCGWMLLSSIPKGARLEDLSWTFDARGIAVKDGHYKTYKQYGQPTLYVKRDGLPMYVANLLGAPVRSTVQDILGSMSKQQRR